MRLTYFIVGCVLFAVVFGFMRVSKQQTTVTMTQSAPAKTESVAAETETQPDKRFTKLARPQPTTNFSAAPVETEASPTPQDALDETLRSEEPIEMKADKLLKLLSTTTGEAQEEIARHTVNLISDEKFPLLGNYLTNSHAPEGLLSILMADMMNRPESVKLPLSLSIAQADNHPLKTEALSLLETFVGEDHGTNWAAWSEAVQARLKKQAEEEQAPQE